MQPLLVDLIVTERCFGSGVAVTADVLATANLLSAALGGPSPLFKTSVRSLDGRSVRTSSGSELVVDGSFDDREGDLVIVFGPGMADVSRVLTDVQEPATAVLGQKLREARARGATLCASCSSTFLLAEAGVLDGRTATTSWWLAPTFRARYPAIELVEDDLVVNESGVITAGAALAQIDLALHLVRTLASPELAQACARYLVVDDARRSQAPFVVVEHLARNDDVVHRAEGLLRADLAAPLRLEALAKAVGVGSKTLTRRFLAATGLPPARFLRRLRLEAAAARLRSTSETVLTIALGVGYDDERAFRRAFASAFGASPTRYRSSRFR